MKRFGCTRDRRVTKQVKSSVLLFAISFIGASSTLGTLQFETSLWRRKILLLHSTRADVEKLFGKPSSGQGYLVGYKLNNGMLDLEYYPFDHCTPSHSIRADLNVPEWTLIGIDFRPDAQPKVASMHLNLSRFRKAHMDPDLPDFMSYFDDQEGIEFMIDEHTHRLNSVRYFPGLRYDALRCSSTPKK